MSVDVGVIEKAAVKLKKPSKWAIILHNDNVTPMDFVVELLYHVFNLNITTATQVMLQVHENGKGVAGIFTYEIAEQKFAESYQLIKLNSMQLKITMEEEC